MCEMLNMFVPVARMPETAPVRGVYFYDGGELQRDFESQFKDKRGTFLSSCNGGMCLCGFDDWDALYELARTVLEQNKAPWLALIRFWSGQSYELTTRELDLYDPEQCSALAEGEVVVLRARSSQHRHRQVVAELSRCVGQVLSLTLKDGRTLRGALADFDAETEVGHVAGRFFVAGQVFKVSREK